MKSSEKRERIKESVFKRQISELEHFSRERIRRNYFLEKFIADLSSCRQEKKSKKITHPKYSSQPNVKHTILLYFMGLQCILYYLSNKGLKFITIVLNKIDWNKNFTNIAKIAFFIFSK